jgi:hypothetical protein
MDIIPLPDALFGLQLKDPITPKIGPIPAFGIPGTVGLGIAGAAVIFGIIRPIFYHRSGSRPKVAAVLNGTHIAVIPDASGIKAVRLSYRTQF